MCRKIVEEICKKMSAKIERNVLGNVLGRTNAVLLRLRVDRHCLKYKKRRKTNQEKKGKREAVRVGQKVICSQFVLRWWSSREGG